MAFPSLEFGIFLAPFHTSKDHPTQSLEGDLDLVVYLDSLGYERAWVGEHHSGGVEIIATLELFIATALERTRQLKFGASVSNLPFHHPLILANRIMQLDHISRGRVSFGMDPGPLPGDAYMMGIQPEQQSNMMREAIEVLVPLLRGETVSRKTSWFELKNARLQRQPFTASGIEMAITSQVSPAGAQTAGSFGLGLLSIGATTTGGYNALASNWEIYERKAKQFDCPVDRRNWSLVGPVHIADSRQQAFENVKYGLLKWIKYLKDVAGLSVAPQDGSDPAQALVESGLAVIGTPDDAIKQIVRLQEQSGGFGCFLQMAHNWANWSDTKTSYELFARHVMPEFQSANTQERPGRVIRANLE